MWSSIHARGYTLVIIITLVLAVVYGPHHRVSTRLVGTNVTSQVVRCPSRLVCPPVMVEVHTVLLPPVSGISQGGGGDGGQGRGGSGGGAGLGAGYGR